MERARRVAAGGAFALAALCGSPAAAAAQDPAPQVVASDSLVEVRLRDGSLLFGRVVEAAGTRVVLVTEGGARVELDRGQIASVQPLRGELRDGVVWEDDPNATRLFFGPTGRTIAAGRGYLGVYELFFPFVAFAPTDAILLAAGTPVVPDFMGEVLYFAPKVRVLSRAGVDASVGALVLVAANEEDLGTVGILYGAGTLGEPNRAVTVGAGWAFSNEEIDNNPVFMLGGEQRVGRRVKLMTENHLFLYDESLYDPSQPEAVGTRTRATALLSGGVRLFGERLSADLGLGAYVGEDTGCCLPLVNFVYSF